MTTSKGQWRIAYYHTTTSALPRQWVLISGTNNIRLHTQAVAMRRAMVYNFDARTYRAVVYQGRNRPTMITEWSIYDD